MIRGSSFYPAMVLTFVNSCPESSLTTRVKAKWTSTFLSRGPFPVDTISTVAVTSTKSPAQITMALHRLRELSANFLAYVADDAVLQRHEIDSRRASSVLHDSSGGGFGPCFLTYYIYILFIQTVWTRGKDKDNIAIVHVPR